MIFDSYIGIPLLNCSTLSSIPSFVTIFLASKLILFTFLLVVVLLTFITFSRFDLTTRDSYFLILVEVFTNHILAENPYFTNHIEFLEYTIMVLKPANKYHVFWQCLNFESIIHDDFQYHSFLYGVKFLQTPIFMELKMTNS